MSVADFCDLVWAEIWDDCPPMADHGTYHDIVTRLFLKGEPAHTITWKDAKGKTQRLSSHNPDITKPMPSDKMAAARALQQQVIEARKAAAVGSAPDG